MWHHALKPSPYVQRPSCVPRTHNPTFDILKRIHLCGLANLLWQLHCKFRGERQDSWALQHPKSSRRSKMVWRAVTHIKLLLGIEMPAVIQYKCKDLKHRLSEQHLRAAVKSLFRTSTSKLGQDWSVHSPRAVNIPAFSDESSNPRHVHAGEFPIHFLPFVAFCLPYTVSYALHLSLLNCPLDTSVEDSCVSAGLLLIHDLPFTILG